MKKAYIIHGAYGNPDENWIPWLCKELQTRGYEVITPTFPTPVNQTLQSWARILIDDLNSFDEETILIGHSIGATFCLSVLENIDICIDKTILVSGFTGKLGIEFDDINKTIAEKEFNWSKIRSHSGSFHVIHGDDDPYVPSTFAHELQEKLNADITIIPNGGHLNESAGFTSLPEVLTYFK